MTEVSVLLITRHARLRAMERRCYPGLGDAEVDQAIARDVREAFEAGRIANHKPRWCRLWGRKNRQLASGQRVVWNEAERIAWIVAIERDSVVVVTTLSRSWNEDAA